MKRHIILSVVLAAGAGFAANATAPDSNDAPEVSAHPAKGQYRAVAAERLAGLMASSTWLSARGKERLFDMMASDETRDEIQQEIAALQEQKEELDRMLVGKMAELEALEAGTLAFNIKQGEVQMLQEQITLVEKKIANLVQSKGMFSRETVMAAVLPLVYLANKKFRNKEDILFMPLVKAALAFLIIDWFIKQRSSVGGYGFGFLRDALGYVGKGFKYIFGEGGALDKAEQFLEDTLSPVTGFISDTFSGAKTDTVLTAAVVVIALSCAYKWNQGRNAGGAGGGSGTL